MSATLHVTRAEAYYTAKEKRAGVTYRGAAKALKRLHMHKLFPSRSFKEIFEGCDSFSRNGLDGLVIQGCKAYECGRVREWSRFLDDDGCDTSFRDIGPLKSDLAGVTVHPTLLRIRLPRRRPRSMHPVSWSSFRLGPSRIAWVAGIEVDDGGDSPALYFERAIANGMLSAARGAQSLCEWYIESAERQILLDNEVLEEEEA